MTQIGPHSFFKKRSTFVPNVSDACISVFEKLVLRDLETVEASTMRIRHNISKRDSECLKELADYQSITIIPADKGGALVVLDRDIYCQEIKRQLNNETFYRKITYDPTLAIQRLIKIVLSEVLALDYISKELFDFLYVEFPRVPEFYILPKIHKPGFPLRGRPILAAQSSLLENISKYIDSLLQPFVTSLRTYIRDTTDFISKVEGVLVPEDAIIVSFNVA